MPEYIGMIRKGDPSGTVRKKDNLAKGLLGKISYYYIVSIYYKI
jgi:hypothetical protein